MPTEFVYIGCTGLSFVAVTWAATQSREYVFAVLTALTMLTSLTAGVLIEVFGWTISLSSALYAGVYLGIDALSESYRKIDAQRAVYYALLANALLMGVALLINVSLPSPAPYASAIREVFGFVPRVVGAALLAFAVASRFEIDLYAWLRRKVKRTPGALAIRNTASTILAQCVDSVLFFGLAFYGLVELEILWELVLTGWLLRVAIAALDTPMLYFIRWSKARRS